MNETRAAQGLPFRAGLVAGVVGAAALALCAGFAHGLTYTIPDAELADTEFTKLSGYSGSGSTLDGRSDVPGPGVTFLIKLAAPDNGKIGIGDPWPTDAAAGFAQDPLHGHMTSLAAYDTYQMTIRYVSGPAGSDIDVSLIMNTGLTGASGSPANDWTNDTFWGGAWMSLALGETKTLTLDFGGAEAWNISDNKAPHTGGGLGWANGGIYAINDRDRNEITNIGLQVADFDGDALGNQVTLHLNAVPEPVTLAGLALGVGSLARYVRKRRLS